MNAADFDPELKFKIYIDKLDLGGFLNMLRRTEAKLSAEPIDDRLYIVIEANELSSEDISEITTLETLGIAVIERVRAEAFTMKVYLRVDEDIAGWE